MGQDKCKEKAVLKIKEDMKIVTYGIQNLNCCVDSGQKQIAKYLGEPATVTWCILACLTSIINFAQASVDQLREVGLMVFGQKYV